MPDFAANLSMMFVELPLLDRFAAAASHGFDAVELAAVAGCPLQGLARGLRGNRLTLVACDLPVREQGIACDPERAADFRELARRGIDDAAALNSRFVTCCAGIAPSGCAQDKVEGTLAANLAFAAERAKEAGLCVLLEAIDNQSMPGAYPHRTHQAVRILDAVRARNLSLLYDVWHMHAMGENLCATITRHLPRIGHIQIAGYPGRGEPVDGAIAFDELLDHIDRVGHRGWVGCEYHPAACTDTGLAWMSRHRRLSPAFRSVWSIPLPALEETSLRSCVTDVSC